MHILPAPGMMNGGYQANQVPLPEPALPMQHPISKLPHLSPTDETLDANQLPVAPLPKETCCPKVQLVEGSGSEQSNETRSLLQLRLRGAALVLLIGSAAFLVRELLTDHHSDPTLDADDRIRFWLHLLHVAVLSIVSVVLFWRPSMSTRQL